MSVVMKYAFVGALFLSLPGCGLLGVGDGSGAGGSSSGSTSTPASGAAVGSSCGSDPNTGETLCLGNSLCPDITVDASVFPECGFLINGSAIDVECVCGGYLCPVGPTATCAAVATLLAQTNEGAVCGQVSTGACVQISTGSAASSSGGSSGCDTVCRDACDGTPTCLEACGC
jgi:hypothetical protein